LAIANSKADINFEAHVAEMDDLTAFSYREATTVNFLTVENVRPRPLLLAYLFG